MGLLEEILSKTKSAVDIVGEKAGQFVDISKLTMNLAELKSIRKKKFENLGEFFYSSKKGNPAVNNPDFSKIFSEIEDLDKNIEKLNQEIAKVKNKLMCKKCGNNNAQNSKYCCECGEYLKYDSCSCQDCGCEKQQPENSDLT
ncbi:MAG: zinc ribbon domain-containing protein [Oscillospiraceae bacterium]|nr:zinc ribbon domain-containing protein [Oscillospiraceae bacterium]